MGILTLQCRKEQGMLGAGCWALSGGWWVVDAKVVDAKVQERTALLLVTAVLCTVHRSGRCSRVEKVGRRNKENHEGEKHYCASVEE